MTKTIPWHAEKETIYHDNNRCQQSKGIPATKRRAGAADRPHCPECEKLNVEAK